MAHEYLKETNLDNLFWFEKSLCIKCLWGATLEYIYQNSI